jgi:hypothetical protein
MIFAKSEPVISVRMPKTRPARTAAVAISSCHGLRLRRYANDAPAATRNARVEVQAHGTWKKTIREDSPMKPLAGSGHRNAAATTAPT